MHAQTRFRIGAPLLIVSVLAGARIVTWPDLLRSVHRFNYFIRMHPMLRQIVDE